MSIINISTSVGLEVPKFTNLVRVFLISNFFYQKNEENVSAPAPAPAPAPFLEKAWKERGVAFTSSEVSQ